MKDDKDKSEGMTDSAWNQDQEVERWKNEYDSLKSDLENLTPDTDLLGELANLRSTDASPGTVNRRAEPRYYFEPDKDIRVFAHIGPREFQILNISVSGLAFYSDTHFEPGTNLLLSALGMVALDVDIVSCEIEETDSDFMEYRYLVRGKFSPRVNGYLVYVLAREMYVKNRKNDQDDPG